MQKMSTVHAPSAVQGGVTPGQVIPFSQLIVYLFGSVHPTKSSEHQNASDA